MTHRKALASLAICLATVATPLRAGDIAFGPNLEGQGWKTLTFRGLKPMSFAAEGPNQLNISGDKAVSVIWRGLDEELWPKRSARWRWRVASGPPASNLAIKGGDDRAIALYFVFARDEAAANAAKGAQSLTSAMWWSSGAALVYVWGGDGARNAVVASPHMGSSGKLILRQPGAVADGTWRPERVDLAADFRRAFGREPGPMVGIAVSSDNDDSGTRTSAAIAGLGLE
ncbi:MAG: DUF3047 domain-containing protein [Bosea sp. (in: a-proteobacteria)]